MMPAMLLFWVVAVVPLVLAAGGCSLVRHEVPASRSDERRAYQAGLLKLEDGVTTRAEVERVLGQPDYHEPAGAPLAAYRWQLVRYEEDLRSALVEDDDDDVNDRSATKVVYHSLLLQFDDNGVLRRHRKRRHKVAYGGPPPLPEMLAAWAAEQASR